MYFPQISNKRVPSSVQKSQKQARPRPKHGPPPPVRFPIRTPWAPKLPLHQPQNPDVLRRHPIPPINHRPPPSCRSRYPDVVVQRNRNRNALKDLAAEAEAELPPRCRRRRAPYQNHSDHAVLRLTAAAPLSQPSTALKLFPLRRPSPPRICFPSADIQPRQHGQKFVHGFVQACTLWDIGATCGGDHTGNRKRYSSSLIRANLMSPLTPYSSHERN